MRHLSTCGRCGGTIEWYESPDPHIRGTQWRHVSATPGGHTHNPDPDDGYVAGPEPEDREPCAACGHVHDSWDDEDECGELVGSGLYGSDGVEVPRPCLCTGPNPRCGLCNRIPAEGERHRQLYAVGETGEDAEEVCVGPDRRQLTYAPLSTPDPWLDPDAAAAHYGLPF